ncbi:unknown similar to AMEV017 [Choristoneura rosaceana entomopoxvirus 'L']|uniref:Uncharacterized protein n=1 Tax=Choristoneura rosaceana entomopoxvirus 'L' TaxID=1293539 RepID=A0ABM9QK64_9POXV|nr:unknown similar to AMEV017 [Choristoneura rosaceana entomopoxvirus 'L']CCU55928.1 unknown similar to AMEV017 [Choristoneura rosaceana entomopoxvirus 'L']
MQNNNNYFDIRASKSEMSLTERKKNIGKMIKNLINANDNLNKQITNNNKMLISLLDSLKKFDCCL